MFPTDLWWGTTDAEIEVPRCAENQELFTGLSV